MKIAFFSNFLNHHQLPLCQGFINKEEIEFKFVACEKTPSDRMNMGYEDMNSTYPFVVKAYENKELAYQIADEYDVVIWGAAPMVYMENRINANKITFRFCERLLKKGMWRRFIPKTRRTIYNAYIKHRNKKFYVLGASAYTAWDLSICGFPKEKCFTWGYFPSVMEFDIEDLIKFKDNQKVEILYAGRLLKLKRVIDSVKAIEKLVKNQITNIHFTIIGEGQEKNNLVKYIQKRKLTNYIDILPFKKPEEVRAFMNKANIYIFGSDFHEGWGAVVNEAMNSACVLLASHAVGSAPLLIKDGVNGYVYPCGNVKKLALILESIVKNKEIRYQVGRKAYETITKEWTAENAVKRLLMLIKRIQEGNDLFELYESGPCSQAKLIKNNWVY